MATERSGSSRTGARLARVVGACAAAALLYGSAGPLPEAAGAPASPAPASPAPVRRAPVSPAPAALASAPAAPASAPAAAGPGPVAAPGPSPSPALLADLGRTIRRMIGLGAEVRRLRADAEQAEAHARALRAAASWQAVRSQALADVVGRLASTQYADGPLSGAAALAFSSDPDALTDRWSAQHQAGRAYALLVRQARRTRSARLTQAASAEAAAADAERAVSATERSGPRLAAHRDALLAELASHFGDATAAAALPADAATAADAAAVGTAPVGTARFTPGAAPDLTPDEPALRAVLFALGRIGRPYVWGGTGPRGYDCSGLTSRAWAAAGVRIPRTSQAQWAALPRLRPGAPLRPGDLVIYFAGATHVGMYIGDGLVVHAPRPGTVVRLTTLGRMPALGVVRPDPGAAGTSPLPVSARSTPGGAWRGRPAHRAGSPHSPRPRARCPRRPGRWTGAAGACPPSPPTSSAARGRRGSR